MENINATISMSLDKRRSKSDSTFPVKLIIYFDGDKKRYKTGISLSEDNWLKLNTINLRDEQLKITKRKLNIYTEKASKVIESIENFTYKEFEARFFSEKQMKRNSNLNELFNEYISFLKENDRIGSALAYGNTIRAIKEFKANVKVTDVTKDFLVAFEKYFFGKNLSPTTISIYMRHLRRIVNVAIANGLLPIQKYPFRGYVIPASRNIKKALDIQQVRLLLNYKTENEWHQKAVDFWLFSYVSNGMNIADVCLLKPENIEGDYFSFHRAKTKNMKKKDLRPIRVPVTELNRRIIEKWRTKDKGNPYLFPILEAGMTAWQINSCNSSIALVADFVTKENALKEDFKEYVYNEKHKNDSVYYEPTLIDESIEEDDNFHQYLLSPACRSEMLFHVSCYILH